MSSRSRWPYVIAADPAAAKAARPATAAFSAHGSVEQVYVLGLAPGERIQRIKGGDQTCAANQALHSEAVNLMSKIRANNHYRPSVADPLSPITFVNKIRVPVYMACQWTDEQTGGHCADLAEHFTGTPQKWFTFTNGTHVDSLDPQTFNRWYDFLELFVAHQAPIVNSAVIQAAAPVIYQSAMGINGVTLPPDPIQQIPTYDPAMATRPSCRAAGCEPTSASSTRPRAPCWSRSSDSPRPTFRHCRTSGSSR